MTSEDIAKADVSAKNDTNSTTSSPSTMAIVPAATAASTEARRKKLKKLATPMMILVYTIGIIWHVFLHTEVSVFTGDFNKPRRVYLDESNLEPGYFRMDVQYDLVPQKMSSRRGQKTSTPAPDNLCDAINSNAHISNDGNNKQIQRIIPCLTIINKNNVAREKTSINDINNNASLQIAAVVPSATAPLSESIVLVVPNTLNWNKSQFHWSILQLVRRLVEAKWLAKTVFIVSSTNQHEQDLSNTVDEFLDLYMGAGGVLESNLQFTSLPPLFSGSIIRQILVIDGPSKNATLSNEVRLLPQGKRGALPNMDLFMVIKYCISQASFLNNNKNNNSDKPTKLIMHPYSQKVDKYMTLLEQHVQNVELRDRIRRILHLFMFEYSLALPPHPPHAHALDLGVDAMTIEVDLARNVDVAECVQKLEVVLRALSNLHERLHHSTALYLLPSIDHFVKHEEYLVPNILLLLPLIFRILKLIFLDNERISLQVIQLYTALTIFILILITSAISTIGKHDYNTQGYAFIPSYAILAIAVRFWKQHESLVYGKKTNTVVSTLQLVLCIVSLYIHVPIAFGHVSLGFWSAALWTPLISFPSYSMQSEKQNNSLFSGSNLSTIFQFALLVATLPNMLLIPTIFTEWTVYVKYVYLPLHVMLSTLWLWRI